MENNIIVGFILVILIMVGGIVSYNYIKNKDNTIMANARLEQCPKTPTWRGSESIWVKDCSRYMKDWQKIKSNRD